MCCFTLCVMSTFSYQIRVNQKWPHVWNGFQATEIHFKYPVPIGHLSVLWLHWPSKKRVLHLGFAFHCNELWNWCSLLNCVYFASRTLPSSCVICETSMGCFCPSITMSCFSQFGTRATSPTKSGSSESIKYFQWVSSYWSPVKIPKVHRAFCWAIAPSA